MADESPDGGPRMAAVRRMADSSPELPALELAHLAVADNDPPTEGGSGIRSSHTDIQYVDQSVSPALKKKVEQSDKRTTRKHAKGRCFKFSMV